MAGDAEATASVVAVDAPAGAGGGGVGAARAAVRVVERAPGDGTVTRASALLDERLDGRWTPRLRSPIAWRRVLFLFTDHLGLTRDPAFIDNVLYILLEEPRPGPADVPGAGPGPSGAGEERARGTNGA